MAIYLTGDTHTNLSSLERRLKECDIQNNTLIICGDFGFIWDGSNKEKTVLDRISTLVGTGTLLFIDGNHENHDLLSKLETTIFGDNEAGLVRDNIFHLRRGHIYNIEGATVLAMGGAVSTDQHWRKEGESWWREEVPSDEDWARCFTELVRHGRYIDLIVTHTLPASLLGKIMTHLRIPFYDSRDRTTRMLNRIYNKTRFERWFAGHWHYGIDLTDNVRVVYHEVVKYEHRPKEESK